MAVGEGLVAKEKYLPESVQPLLTDLIEDLVQDEGMPEDAESFVIDWLRRRAGSREGQGRTTCLSLRQRNQALKQELSDLETAKAKADHARAEDEKFRKIEKSLALLQARQDEQFGKMEQSMASFRATVIARQDEHFGKLEKSLMSVQAQQDAQLATTRELFASLLQVQEKIFAKMEQPIAAPDTVPIDEEMDTGKDKDEMQTPTKQIETSLVEVQIGVNDELPEGSLMSSSSGPLQEFLYLTLKEEAAITDSDNIAKSYHGHISENASSCWVSFPGKYAAGWEALVKEYHEDSVACVFLCTPEDGLGQHSDDPENPGKCHCPRIYGVRDWRPFGYLMVMQPPYTDERLRRHKEMADAMNAVFVRADAPQSEQEEAIKKAEAQWQKCDCVASWGCAWYPKWLDRVREAVARGQRLKAVFFPKQVGQGKLSMEELSREKVDLWDNVGCGGSQKCELATLDRLQKQEGSKWDYDEVDVADFLGSEFTAGCPVYAKTKGEGGEEWRRGVLVRQKTRGTIGGRVSWLVRCEKTQETFETCDLRHASVSVEQIQEACGHDVLLEFLSDCLPGTEITAHEAARLPTGAQALRATIRISGIMELHSVRDSILNGDFERSFNEKLASKAPTWKVQVDKKRFFELYEDSLLALESLTPHQVQKLGEMQGVSHDMHLSAPAGAGKTFVAVQHVMDTLCSSASGKIVYVAPNEALGLHFLRWLATRVAAQSRKGDADLAAKIRHVFSRLRLLHQPYTHILAPSLDGDRIVRRQENIGPQDFQLAVCDESHSYLHNDSTVGKMIEGRIAARRRLLLSDESQSSAISQSYPEMQRVKLTEVVRSTKRIVAGAAAFQLHADTSETVTSLGTDGPPLKTFLFQLEEQGKKFDEYARQIVKAVVYIEQVFPGVALHRRVAILTPDKDFLDRLRPRLQTNLNQHFSHRSFRLESFVESLEVLPERVLRRSPQQTKKQESLVVDAMEQADGLEQMIVVCAGLDSAIQSSTEDLQTRAQLYRGITRAQLLAVVVNEHVPGGWLEFLGGVKYQDAALSDREADSPRVAEAARKRHQAALAEATAENPSRQDQTAALHEQSWLKAAQGTASSVVPSGVWDTLHRMNPWDTSASPPKASSQPKAPAPKASSQPKAPAAVKTSSVWDTDSNSIPAPTELLFDPLPEAAREEVYATSKPRGWEASTRGRLKCCSYPNQINSVETASTGILRWCIKSHTQSLGVLGVIPAEKAGERDFLRDNLGYGIKSKGYYGGAGMPEFDLGTKYIEVIADLDARVAKVMVGDAREQMLEVTSFDIPFQGDATLAIIGEVLAVVQWLPRCGEPEDPEGSEGQASKVASSISGEDSDSSADSYARAGVSRDWAGIG
ncbi:unnamed protein product [Symbiodinium sp. KB8]|nr:unnamed protein product [Symbiodinium sp. KB8]